MKHFLSPLPAVVACAMLRLPHLAAAQGVIPPSISTPSIFRLTLASSLIVLVAVADTGTAQQRITTEEAPGEVLAVQLRRQGHRCDAPVIAEQDAARSRPDGAVWVLKCANDSYRMRLVPDMAAAIERLN